MAFRRTARTVGTADPTEVIKWMSVAADTSVAVMDDGTGNPPYGVIVIVLSDRTHSIPLSDAHAAALFASLEREYRADQDTRDYVTRGN